MRKMKPSDVDGLYKALSDADTMTHVEPPFSFEQTKRFAKTYGICDDPKVFALIYDKSKLLIGHVIFHPFDDDVLENRYGKGKVYELGWVIRKDFWRQGIATETALALIDYSKTHDISALVIECDPDCFASMRIAQKLGFARQTPDGSQLEQFVLALK